MPDTFTLTLILLVGIAVGVLFTLVLDSTFLEKRLQEEKNRLLRLENRLALAKSEIRHLREDLENAEGWREQATCLLEEKVEIERRLAVAEAQVCYLEAQVKGTLRQLTETQKLRKQIVEAEVQNRMADAEIKNLQARLQEAQNQIVFMRREGQEDLTLIHGIGPTYARRLQEAGIKTLSALAQATPDRLSEIVKLKEWQNAEPDKWIAEAKELAAVFADEEE